MKNANQLAVSRRTFTRTVALSGVFAALPKVALAEGTITPRAVVEHIRAACAAQGIEWSEETVDTFKIGNPDTPVTSIVATFMATLGLMQRAVDAGANFIISHEPIFYNHLDETEAFRDDPVYLAKVRFAEQHGLTVWRFHDHLHQIEPEPVSTAFNRQLGWEPYLDQGATGFRRRVQLSPVTLEMVAHEIAQKLPSRSVRVIGDPALEVTRVGQAGHGIGGVINCYADCDVAIGAEIREWDSAEYARDALQLDMPKALVMIAHERGEEDGMALFVAWLKAVVPGVSVNFIPSGEPFWAL
jgi:putative NIF3 family GTP cyclohydrolase 1 type 2